MPVKSPRVGEIMPSGYSATRCPCRRYPPCSCIIAGSDLADRFALPLTPLICHVPGMAEVPPGFGDQRSTSGVRPLIADERRVPTGQLVDVQLQVLEAESNT